MENSRDISNFFNVGFPYDIDSLAHIVSFWGQKLHHFFSFWAQKNCWTIFTISGPRNSNFLSVSGSRNCTILSVYGARNVAEPFSLFLGPEIVTFCHFRGPEIAPYFQFLVSSNLRKNVIMTKYILPYLKVKSKGTFLVDWK